MIFSAGYSSTYFALESFFWRVVLTIGACHGVAFVTVYSVANGAAQRWFPPEHREAELCLLLLELSFKLNFIHWEEF